VQKLIDIIESLFLIYVAWWGYGYCTGKWGYTGKNQQRRLERVERYGWLIWLASIVSFISGLALLLSTII